MLLEICANSFASALNAEKAGAHRIEICSELQAGGITPSYGLLKLITSKLTIDTFVLIRPRSGNFVYSEQEFEIMKENIIFSKEMGCKGIVSGILDTNNEIDEKRTSELIKLSSPLPFTFHRAFDLVKNTELEIQKLITLGVHRVLTSGKEKSAEKGLNLLKKMNEKYRDKITILPGGGISASNAALFKKEGFLEIHSSASKKMNTESNYFGTVTQTISDGSSIKKILQAIR